MDYALYRRYIHAWAQGKAAENGQRKLAIFPCWYRVKIFQHVDHVDEYLIWLFKVVIGSLKHKGDKHCPSSWLFYYPTHSTKEHSQWHRQLVCKTLRYPSASAPHWLQKCDRKLTALSRDNQWHHVPEMYLYMCLLENRITWKKSLKQNMHITIYVYIHIGI